MIKMKDLWGKVTWRLEFRVFCKECVTNVKSITHRKSSDFKEHIKRLGWKDLDGYWYCSEHAKGIQGD